MLNRSGSRDVVDFYNSCPIGVERNVESAVDQVGMGLDVVQRRLEELYLLGPPYGRQQEDDAGMQLDFAISAAKFDRVVGHQHPVLFRDDLQQIPIRLRA